MSNLRARNYRIDEISAFDVKIIAGKIIPALSTTTTMVVGAVGMEIIKTVLKKDVSKMKNSFMNLALPLWIFSTPQPPIQAVDKEYDVVAMGPIKAVPPKFSKWDVHSVKGPMTAQQLIDYVMKTFNVDLSMVNYKDKVSVYNKYSPYEDQSAGRLNRDIVEIIQKEAGENLPNYRKYLDLDISGEIEGVEAIMPHLKYEL